MKSGLCIAVGVLFGAWLLPARAAQAPGRFCGAAGATAAAVQLPWRDDGSLRPDFAKFRSELQHAVQVRDVAAVLDVVHPEIRVGFDGAGGVEAFKSRRIGNSEENFWQESARVLALGGRFRNQNAFDAPYVFADWPDDFDPFECVAITGRNVRLRARPSLAAPVVRLVSFQIVESISVGAEPAEWRQIRLVNGQTGFIAAQYVRSPVDYRAMFEFRDGRWWLVAYVAGD